jgi:hypothetical protein
MGLFDRLRFWDRRGPTKSIESEQRECLHGTLVARWEDAADMGDESKATEFVCQSCQERFTPKEAAWVRKRAVERLRR